MRSFIVILGVVVIEVAVFVNLAPLTNRTRLQPTDFVNLYAGGLIVRHGDGAKLYQRETQDAAFQSILARKSTQYFLHPPFEAAALAPITLLNLEQAFVVWTLINVAVLGLLPLVLMQCIPLVGRRAYLGLLGFCFLPVLTALTLGQDSIVLLFVMSGSYLLAYKRMDLAAGMVLALAAIKFQYLAILVPLLVVSRKWRVGAGFSLGCGCLALVSSWITGGPRGLLEYFRFVGTFDAHSGYGGLNPTLMVNCRGFLAGIGWTAHRSGYAFAAGIVLFALGVACGRIPSRERNTGLLFALYVAIALAAAPYAHFPDMAVLLLPALIAMDRVAGRGMKTVSRKLIFFSCVALFAWPWLLLILGRHYWWNSRIYLVFPLIVVFIAALAAEVFADRAVHPLPEFVRVAS